MPESTLERCPEVTVSIASYEAGHQILQSTLVQPDPLVIMEQFSNDNTLRLVVVVERLGYLLEGFRGGLLWYE